MQEIIDKAHIVDVVGQYVQLNQKGDRFWGLSPFKAEKTPSFSVSPDKNIWYCFSTQKGGGVVQFVMELEQISYVEALNFLAKKYGINTNQEDEEAFSQDYKQKKALIELYARLTDTFSHLLMNTKQGESAHKYLKDRGIDDQTITTFKLGYLYLDGSWLYKFLLSKKYSASFLDDSGLFGKNKKEYCIFSGRIIFPILDQGNETIAFGGRILQGNGPKYINSPETSIFKKGSVLFGINLAKDFIKKGNQAIICEGYMDVIALHAASAKNALAPLGTAFTNDQAKLVKRMCNKISFLFDSDEAGIKAGMRSLIIAEDNEIDCDFIKLEGEKDPADIFQKKGSQFLLKMLDYRLTVFDFILRVGGLENGTGSPEAKKRLLNAFLPYLDSIRSPIKKEAVLRMLSDLLEVGVNSLQAELNRSKVANKNKPLAIDSEVKMSQALLRDSSSLDLQMMIAVVINPLVFGKIRNQLKIEDLKHQGAQELFICLEESYRLGLLSFEHVASRIGSPDLRSIVFRKNVDGEYVENAEGFIKDCTLRIRERNLRERRISINYQLRRVGNDSSLDSKMERDLLEDMIVIDEALKELRKQIDDRLAE